MQQPPTHAESRRSLFGHLPEWRQGSTAPDGVRRCMLHTNIASLMPPAGMAEHAQLMIIIQHLCTIVFLGFMMMRKECPLYFCLATREGLPRCCPRGDADPPLRPKAGQGPPRKIAWACGTLLYLHRGARGLGPTQFWACTEFTLAFLEGLSHPAGHVWSMAMQVHAVHHSTANNLQAIYEEA